MTRLVTPRFSAQLQRLTEGHTYTDRAYYIAQASTASLDEYGQPTPSTDETLISCSFTDKPKMERWLAVDIQEVEAEIRQSTVTPEKGGKFRVIKRFSETITARTYEVIGIQDRGAFGYVCALKAVSI